MGVTIKDVAKLANVSAMTVSRVVNNHKNISFEAQRKVLAAIESLGYKPNTIARTLVAQKSKVISLIVPDIANPFFSELIKVAEYEIKKQGYNLIIGNAGWHIDYELDFINASIGRMSDGVILVTPRVTEEEIIRLHKQVPIVVVDRKMSHESLMDVYVDNYDGAYAAASYLIQQGHRRIGYIRGYGDVLNTIRREKGYLDALQKNDIPFDPSLVTIGDYETESGYQAFDFFYNRTDRPTAVFASNDLMAYGFISACQQHGLNVPNDISVMGFDDIKLFINHNPALTTVSHPRIAMIRKAVNLLLKTENEETANLLEEQLITKLVIRDSVANITEKKNS